VQQLHTHVAEKKMATERTTNASTCFEFSMFENRPAYALLTGLGWLKLGR